MKNFLKKKLGIDLDQPSTKKGVALVGAEYGGIVGTAVPVLLGLWETFRKEFD